MAAFDYTGWAIITWKDGRKTEQYIDYVSDRDILRVWPENDEIEEHEYLGSKRNHPADNIRFLHRH
jgi:hypothetical protein